MFDRVREFAARYFAATIGDTAIVASLLLFGATAFF